MRQKQNQVQVERVIRVQRGIAITNGTRLKPRTESVMPWSRCRR